MEREDGTDSPGEIEITPAMIAAGLAAYREEGTLIEEADDADKSRIFIAIFSAMFSASRSRTGQ